MVRPIEVEGQRASALRFGDPRVQALFAVLAVFSLQFQGFTKAELRALLAQMLGLDPASPLPVLTWFALAIHLLAKKIDPRVKPAGDGEYAWSNITGIGISSRSRAVYLGFRPRHRNELPRGRLTPINKFRGGAKCRATSSM